MTNRSIIVVVSLVVASVVGTGAVTAQTTGAADRGYTRPELLVDTAWLAAHLNDPDIRIVDVRRQGYADGHIPNAVALNIDATRDFNNPPTFAPAAARFEQAMGELGISSRTRVITYDERGGIYAARLWFILNYFGHTNVALLDGGWVKWSKENRPITSDVPGITPAVFKAGPGNGWIATAADVTAAIGKPGMKIVDARTQAEIEGRDLRGIRRGGYVPSAIPVYWEDLLDPELKSFRPAAELEGLFKDRGITPADSVITYCQVGMRASVDLFALYLLGYDNLRNYYGAWQEWGNRDDLPIVTK